MADNLPTLAELNSGITNDTNNDNLPTLAELNENQTQVGKTTDSSTETQAAESNVMGSGSEDGGLVYEYQTPDKARFPDAVPAWGKSTDGGKNFEVVNADSIPEDWFNDPKFKQVYEAENKTPENKEEASNLEQLKNIFTNSWPQLKNAYEGTKAGIVDYVRIMGGDDAADFMLGKSDGGVSLIDPESGERVTFDKDAYKRDGKQAVENSRYYELVRSEDQPELVYNKTGKKVGDATDDFLIDQFKKVEANKLEFKDTGKGIVGGFKDGDVADIALGGVNAMVSVFTTVVPAVITRGASLAPQIIAPMYTDYNTEKAKALYGDKSSTEEAIEKLITNNETEVAIPAALGLAAVGLEKIGIKGISKYVAAKTFTGKGAAQLVMTGNKEALTEWFQGGVEQVNIGTAKGNSKEKILSDTWEWMKSDEGKESFIQGFVGGTGMAAGSKAIQTAMRDDKANLRVNEHINALGGLQQARTASNSAEVKKSIDKKINEVEESLKNYITTNKKISKYLTQDQSKELVSILDSKKDLKSQITKLQEQKNAGVISETEFELAS